MKKRLRNPSLDHLLIVICPRFNGQFKRLISC